MTMSLYRTFGDAGFVIGPVLLGGLADLAGFGWALAFNALLLVSVALLFAVFARETLQRRVAPPPQEVV
jgi:MFS family permease